MSGRDGSGLFSSIWPVRWPVSRDVASAHRFTLRLRPEFLRAVALVGQRVREVRAAASWLIYDWDSRHYVQIAEIDCVKTLAVEASIRVLPRFHLGGQRWNDSTAEKRSNNRANHLNGLGLTEWRLS